MDITAMLHIRHLDYGKTETWRSDRNPLHGTLTFSGATAVSGGADIAPPARSVVYTPAPGYVGTDSFLVTVWDGLRQTTPRTFNVTVLPPEPVPAPAPQSQLGQYRTPPIAGIVPRPDVLDLASAYGPKLLRCVRDTLGSLLGGNPVYVGQNPDGSARMDLSGQYLSFYVLDASSSSSGQGNGVALGETHRLGVNTACGTAGVVPALSNLTEFGAVLSEMGLTASVSAQGVITLTMDGRLYVLRPDYQVSVGAPGVARFVKETDGTFRFFDSAGGVQVLRPAFLEPAVLAVQLRSTVPLTSFLIQTDGSGLLSLVGGSQYVLTPDASLGGVPADRLAEGWWPEGLGRYTYRTYGVPSSSQSFTVSAQQ